MAQYELTFLLNEEAELKNLKTLIMSLEGTVTKEDKWGERELAYSIKKNTSAVFYNWQFTIEEKNINEFKKKLNFTDKMIRYLLLKAGDE